MYTYVQKLCSKDVPEKTKFITFKIKFIETYFEAIPQLFLSLHILSNFGLDEKTIFFKGDIQVFSLFGSILSILYNSSLKYAYIKYNEYPTHMQIFQAFLFNCIPILSAILSFYVILSKPKYSMIIYLIMTSIVLLPMYIIPLISFIGMVLSYSVFCPCVCIFTSVSCLLFGPLAFTVVPGTIISKVQNIYKIVPSFLTVNRILSLFTFFTALIHTVHYIFDEKFDEMMLMYFSNNNQSYYGYGFISSEFNICYADNSTIPIFTQYKNPVGKDPYLFVYMLWLFFLMCVLNLFLELKFNTITPVSCTYFIVGPKLFNEFDEISEENENKC